MTTIIEIIELVVLIFGAGTKTESVICGSNCIPDPDNTTKACNTTSGDCLYGCTANFEGSSCSVQCPLNCALSSQNESKTCNAWTAECLHGCKDGFVGSNCSTFCPDNCASGNRGEDMCDEATGDCLLGCKDGFYGYNCTRSCDDAIAKCKRCSLSEIDGDVICNECIRNFYRENEKKCKGCNHWCAKNNSSNSALCRENDGYCNHGCSVGRYGFYCGDRCSSTCKDGCHRETGYCEGGCKYVSYCGLACNTSCQNGCKAKHCNQTCDCVEGCTPTFWGNQCQTVCNFNCVKPDDPLERVCNNVDGTCIFGCNGKTFWGKQCNEPCSNNCVNGTCEQYSGICTYGCTTDTVYDLPCDKPCNENCMDGTCKRADGYCKNGCKVGKYGTKCDIDCSRNCLNNSCTREEGHCIGNCEIGYYGDTCNDVCSHTCLNTACERESGNCTDGCVPGYGGYHCLSADTTDSIETKRKDTWMIVGIVFIIVSAVLAVYAVFVTITRRICVRKREQVRPTDPTPEQDFKVTKSKREPVVGTSSDEYENTVKMYIDLVQYSKNDNTTYDIIQNN